MFDLWLMFFSFVYSFCVLFEMLVVVCYIDLCLGYFLENYSNFGDDFKVNFNVYLLVCWWFEKKDFVVVLFELVQFIVYWLDKNILVKYCEFVKVGVLEWNKVFEKIGFKNVIVVRQ